MFNFTALGTYQKMSFFNLKQESGSSKIFKSFDDVLSSSLKVYYSNEYLLFIVV